MFPPVYSTLAGSPAGALVGGRIFRDLAAADNDAKPYIVWSIVFGQPFNCMAGIPNDDRWQTQVYCWGASQAQAIQVAEAVRAALEPVAELIRYLPTQTDQATQAAGVGMDFDWIEQRN